MKKIILGLGIFSLLSGNIIAAELQPLTERAEKQSQYTKGSRLNACLENGEAREECIEKLKKGRKAEKIKAEKVRKEFKKEKRELKEERKELKEERKELKNDIKSQRTDFKKDAKDLKAVSVEKAKSLRSDFENEMKEAETDEERSELKEKFAAKRDMLKGESKEKRDELKKERIEKIKEVKEKRKNFLEKRLKNILRKYVAYQKRAHSVYDRIAFNIDKLKKAGVDVTALEKYQAQGKESLLVVDRELTAAKKGVEEVLSGNLEKDEIRKNLVLIKENLKEAKKAMKEYFAGVQNIVKELRKNKKEDEDGSRQVDAIDHNSSRSNRSST